MPLPAPLGWLPRLLSLRISASAFIPYRPHPDGPTLTLTTVESKRKKGCSYSIDRMIGHDSLLWLNMKLFGTVSKHSALVRILR